MDQVLTKHKRTLRDLIAGREVARSEAYAALRWLRVDATVIETASGNVRLRVPMFQRSAFDLRGSGV